VSADMSADVRDRRTVLEQQTREGVPHLMRAAAMQVGRVE
jgi:hypothetical protein